MADIIVESPKSALLDRGGSWIIAQSNLPEKPAVMYPTINLSAWRLDPDGQILRQPLRPPAYRGPGFEQSFDFTTVFCDTFWSADGHSIILVGPALWNLEQELDIRFVSKPADVTCEHVTHHRGLVDRIKVAAPPGTELLLAQTTLGDMELLPQPNLAELFRDKRAILTKNKDNDLAWIHDWALFHQRRHGCDGVLIYDNGSTRYASKDVANALFDIDGLDEVIVIDWPFPWGPVDGIPDSQFCQLTVLEHARLRCLTGAKSVLQGDVDELVLTENGESVFALAERSKAGYLRYGGRWVEAIKGNGADDATANDTTLRHRDFHHVMSDVDRKCKSKWTCVPAKDRQDGRWSVHRNAFDRFANDRKLASLVSLRHFKAISTGWKIGRSAPVPFDPKVHRPDHELRSALDAVFGDRGRSPVRTAKNTSDFATENEQSHAKEPTGQRLELEALAFVGPWASFEERRRIAQELVKEYPDDPRLRYLFAKMQRRRGDVDGAISSLLKAIELDPTYAPVHERLGALYARQGKIEDAINALSSAVEVNPNYFHEHQLLSHLYLEVGQIDNAIAALRRALAASPDEPGLCNQLGNLLEKQGEVDEAIAFQHRAIDLGMAGPGMHRKLASLYVRQRNFREAIKQARHALAGYGVRLVSGER